MTLRARVRVWNWYRVRIGSFGRASLRERCSSFRGRHASPPSSSLRSRRATLGGLPRGLPVPEACRFSAGRAVPASAAALTEPSACAQ